MLGAELLILGRGQAGMFLECGIESGFVGVADGLGNVFDSVSAVFRVFQILAGLADSAFIDQGIEIFPVVFIDGGRDVSCIGFDLFGQACQAEIIFQAGITFKNFDYFFQEVLP